MSDFSSILLLWIRILLLFLLLLSIEVYDECWSFFQSWSDLRFISYVLRLYCTLGGAHSIGDRKMGKKWKIFLWVISSVNELLIQILLLLMVQQYNFPVLCCLIFFHIFIQKQLSCMWLFFIVINGEAKSTIYLWLGQKHMTLKIENGGKGQQRFKSMRRGKEGGGGLYSIMVYSMEINLKHSLGIINYGPCREGNLTLHSTCDIHLEIRGVA